MQFRYTIWLLFSIRHINHVCISNNFNFQIVCNFIYVFIYNTQIDIIVIARNFFKQNRTIENFQKNATNNAIKKIFAFIYKKSNFYIQFRNFSCIQINVFAKCEKMNRRIAKNVFIEIEIECHRVKKNYKQQNE